MDRTVLVVDRIHDRQASVENAVLLGPVERDADLVEVEDGVEVPP